MRNLVETMRLDDGPRHLLAMCVAHGSAMHAGNIGYKGLASEKWRVVLELLEEPLAAELSAVSPVSRTGVHYWLLIPAILQMAAARRRCPRAFDQNGPRSRGPGERRPHASIFNIKWSVKNYEKK